MRQNSKAKEGLNEFKMIASTAILSLTRIYHSNNQLKKTFKKKSILQIHVEHRR